MTYAVGVPASCLHLTPGQLEAAAELAAEFLGQSGADALLADFAAFPGLAIALTIDGTARQRAGKLLGYGVGRGSRPPVVWSDLRCHVLFCVGQGQVRHSARLEPLGTRSGAGQAGVVEEYRTGGASMWTSPSGLGAL